MESTVINGVKFVEVQPIARGGYNRTVLNVSMRSDGALSFSKPLRDIIGVKVRVLRSEDGKQLVLRPGEHREAFTMHEDGFFYTAMLRDALMRAGITIPCRYNVAQEGGTWIGTLMEEPPTPKPDKAARKPRKMNLADMLPEGSRP